MSNNFVDCPYCHKTVIKGAMRCVACGKLLQTPEEKIAAIKKLQSRQQFNISKLLKYTVMIIILGLLFDCFSERFIEIVEKVIGP